MPESLYDLDKEGNVIKVDYYIDFNKRWFLKTKMTKSNIDIEISTVFLGINHNWIDGKLPILFETMIFGLLGHELQWRYATQKEAIGNHEKLVYDYLADGYEIKSINKSSDKNVQESKKPTYPIGTILED